MIILPSASVLPIRTLNLLREMITSSATYEFSPTLFRTSGNAPTTLIPRGFSTDST
jgi:hypothetical protein